jgi:hypothetical protein
MLLRIDCISYLLQVFDLESQVDILNLVPVPVWFYDHTTCCNVWGNR